MQKVAHAYTLKDCNQEQKLSADEIFHNENPEILRLQLHFKGGRGWSYKYDVRIQI